MTAYPNYWPGWETDVLKAAGLPATPQNITFLANWHNYEGSAAVNNPLNVTAYAPVPVTVGYQELAGNSSHIQYYASSKQGAAATAAFFGMPNFAAIKQGLATGDIYAWSAKSDANKNAIVSALQTWGSDSFALVFAYQSPASTAPGTQTKQAVKNPDTGNTTTSTTTAPGPFSDPLGLSGFATGVEKWLVGKGKLVLAYMLLAAVGVGLIVTGLKGLGAPVPKIPKGVPVPV